MKPFVIPRLGIVTMEDRLVDYDGPLLFTIRTENGGRYIAFSAFDDAEQSVYWLNSIDDIRYRGLLNGTIDVRIAFLGSDLLEVRRDNKSGRYLNPP